MVNLFNAYDRVSPEILRKDKTNCLDKKKMKVNYLKFFRQAAGYVKIMKKKILCHMMKQLLVMLVGQYIDIKIIIA